MNETMRSQINQYSAILRIRQKARRRDVLITGGVFLLSILATFALGLLGELEGREIYLLMVFLIAFGVSFMMSWVRLEIIKNTLEFADTLEREVSLSS